MWNDLDDHELLMWLLWSWFWTLGGTPSRKSQAVALLWASDFQFSRTWSKLQYRAAESVLCNHKLKEEAGTFV